MFSSSINDTSRVVSVTIVSDAQCCGVTYCCHSDDTRGAIYAPIEQASIMTIVIYDRHIFYSTGHRLERLTSDKHSSLSDQGDEEKKVS